MGNFFDKDNGFKEFMANMKMASGEDSVFVGYLRSAKPYQNKKQRKGKGPPKPITLAQLAAVHEFGSQDGHIRQRSFIRSAMKDHSRELKKLQAKLMNAVIDGKMNKKKALGILGQHIVDWIKGKIDSGVPPKNAPSTVKAKGSDHTLIDTGQLRNSVDWEVRKGKG